MVLGGVGLWYAVSAKNWFKGPKVQGTPEELAAIERDLELAEGSEPISAHEQRTPGHRPGVPIRSLAWARARDAGAQ